jgi:CubicO group peptidase (beta-lactamase class C family)
LRSTSRQRAPISPQPIKPSPHGGPFRYVSANSDLVGWALERATGHSFADLVSELLWRPPGAEQPASITLTPSGLSRTTGGFSMVARDVARLGQLILQHGRREAGAIVPEAWIEDVWTNGDREAWKAGEWAGCSVTSRFAIAAAGT